MDPIATPPVETVNVVQTLGTAGGILVAVTALTQITKRLLRTWPVPPMALVYGELLWFATWRAGWLDIGVEPVGATGWEWLLVGAAGVTNVVLAAMGASTLLETPTAAIKRGGDSP